MSKNTKTTKRQAGSLTRRVRQKPCKQLCPKCGGNDIHREHRERSDRVDKRGIDDPCHQKPPFLTSNWPYGYKATKEHIGHHCRDCGYEWQCDVLPNNRIPDAGPVTQDETRRDTRLSRASDG